MIDVGKQQSGTVADFKEAMPLNSLCKHRVLILALLRSILVESVLVQAQQPPPPPSRKLLQLEGQTLLSYFSNCLGEFSPVWGGGGHKMYRIGRENGESACLETWRLRFQ